MRVAQVRDGTYSLTATRQEIGALVAAARMALNLLETDPNAPKEALPLLRGVLADWDAALARESRGASGPPASDSATS
jgi:hypothetical protein